MPVATPFAYLGAGNGFTSCLSKVDVSSKTYWTTLSGLKKGDVVDGVGGTQAQIDASRVHAMNLFYNLYGMGGTSAARFDSYTVWPSFDISVSGVNGDNLLDDFYALLPKDRVCGLSYWAINSASESEGSVFLKVSASEGFFEELYNGSTSDMSKFLGYGLSSSILNGRTLGRLESYSEIGDDRSKALVGLSSYTTSTIGLDLSRPSIDALTDIAYVNVNGISFVATATAMAYNQLGFDKSLEADAAAMTASSFLDWTGVVIQAGTYNTSASITPNSLEFYTYP